MEIAALISFGVLLVALLMAPDGRTTRTASVEREPAAAIA